MQRFDSILGDLLFGFLALIAVGSTWLFGAWENWWFWPFVTLIFATSACFAGRLMLSPGLGARRLNISTLAIGIIVAWIPFLIYALIRAIQADVRMDAERSFLLQLTPVLLGVMVATGLPEARQRILITLVMVNFGLLGLYGILNHTLAGNARVLWVPGFPQYQETGYRATGSYFCPDHFSGLMELALSMALALLLVRSSSRRQRGMAMGLACIALLGIILSGSRGGGIVTGIVVVTALMLCTMSWPEQSRRLVRRVGLTGVVILAVVFVLFGGSYVKRFKEYPWTKLEQSDRFQMSSAALRAWKTAPWFGVGPGMHQNLWPHFAPSPDGDREKGIWPTFPNNTFHSFEAHNDWAQCLEEYGVIGVALLLTAAGTAVRFLYRRWKRWSCVLASGSSLPIDSGLAWLLPGLLLAALAMAVHSFGDFNLQIPGTTWLLGILAGLAVAIARHTPPFPRRRSGDTP
ncbi:MAG: O-antigen ligase family protein [bacterium]